MSANNNNECNEFHVFGDCQYCDISKFDNCIECTGRVWDSGIGRHIQEDDDCDGGVVCKKCVAKQEIKLSKCFYCDNDKICRYRFGLVTICDDCEDNDDNDDEEEFLETKCGCAIRIDSREHDECRCDDDGKNWICADCYNGEYDEEEDDMCECEDDLPDEHFKCDKCNVIKHCDYYVSLDNDPTGNTICDKCINVYVKENGLEEDDMCECENCGADFDNEGWSPKMKYCEHCDDELRNNGL